MPGLVALLVSLALTLLALRMFSPPKSAADRAAALLASGKLIEGEAAAAALVRDDPTVPHVLFLVDAHRLVGNVGAEKKDDEDVAMVPAPSQLGMTDADVDTLIASLPAEVARVGRFARGDENARREFEVGANAEPPVPWANHVLARDARFHGDHREAAKLYLREGLAFPARIGDVDTAITLFIGQNEWEQVDEYLQDPRIAAALQPDTNYEIAVHHRDWRGAAWALPQTWLPRFAGAGPWLSAIAALAWGFFCTRLGRVGDRPWFRLPLYVVAFVFGVASIGPTLFLISVEEASLHLVETGDLLRDLLFYVFGVGLREEASKLLLFALLLPVLRKWGDKLDVLACGAMVGLGFAAEENLGYLAGGNLGMGLARFLSANFLHMAMTGLLASALDDFLRDGERHGADFFRKSLLVVGIHGVYDCAIGHPEIGGGYASAIVFFFLAKMFVDAVDAARKKADRGFTPVHAFVVAFAVVTGASFAHAIDTVGLRTAPMVMLPGLLAEGITVAVFVRVFDAVV